MASVNRLDFAQRVQLIDHLRAIGQEAIDKARMTYADLAARASRDLGFPVSPKRSAPPSPASDQPPGVPPSNTE